MIGTTIVVTEQVNFAAVNLLWQIVIMAAAYIIGMVLAPKPVPPKPAALEDLDIPQFEEGTAQPVIFGDCWTKSWMVLGYGNFRTTPIKKKGGKK